MATELSLFKTKLKKKKVILFPFVRYSECNSWFPSFTLKSFAPALKCLAVSSSNLVVNGIKVKTRTGLNSARVNSVASASTLPSRLSRFLAALALRAGPAGSAPVAVRPGAGRWVRTQRGRPRVTCDSPGSLQECSDAQGNFPRGPRAADSVRAGAQRKEERRGGGAREARGRALLATF